MSAAVLLLIPIALFVLLVRPQRQRVNAQRALLSGLAPGDEVVTSGGLIGTLVSLGEAEASLEISPGTVVRVALPAIIGRPRPPEPDVPADPPHSEDA
jgi:preprotein translocase subunit YajC